MALELENWVKKIIAPDIFRSYAVQIFASFYPINQFESQFKRYFDNLVIVILKFTDYFHQDQFTTANRLARFYYIAIEWNNGVEQSYISCYY